MINDAGEAYTTYRMRERVGDKHRIVFNTSFEHPAWVYTVTCHGNGEGANTIVIRISSNFWMEYKERWQWNIL